MKLSERLDAEAASWESWNRDFPEDQSPLTPVLLREAAALAKRYEDAPMGNCVACDFEGYERPTWHVIDDRDAVPLTLRGRVRIVLDKEG